MIGTCCTCVFEGRGTTDSPCNTCEMNPAGNLMTRWQPKAPFMSREEVIKTITLSEDSLAKVKDRGNKVPASMILPNAAAALCRVREYGLKKYPDAENWKRVPVEDWENALMRHLLKYLDGKENDNESGLPHLWHALANLSYMIEQIYGDLLEEKKNAE